MATKQSKLAGLFVFALVILNFPLLGIFKHTVIIGGIPAVFLYLFGVWLLIIFLMRQTIEARTKDKRDKFKDDKNM